MAQISSWTVISGQSRHIWIGTCPLELLGNSISESKRSFVAPYVRVSVNIGPEYFMDYDIWSDSVNIYIAQMSSWTPGQSDVKVPDNICISRCLSKRTSTFKRVSGQSDITLMSLWHQIAQAPSWTLSSADRDDLLDSNIWSVSVNIWMPRCLLWLLSNPMSESMRVSVSIDVNPRRRLCRQTWEPKRISVTPDVSVQVDICASRSQSPREAYGHWCRCLLGLWHLVSQCDHLNAQMFFWLLGNLVPQGKRTSVSPDVRVSVNIRPDYLMNSDMWLLSVNIGLSRCPFEFRYLVTRMPTWTLASGETV